jgi:hypothetical protein
LKIIRLRKEYRLKVWMFIILTFILCYFIVPRSNRAMAVSFFSKKCRNYQQVYSRKLNDRIPDYSAQAKLTGIEVCADANDIGKRISSRELFRVKGGRRYLIEDMSFSYPYLTKDSKKLLDEISRRFKAKVDKDGLKGSKFIITSMTRTSNSSKHNSVVLSAMPSAMPGMGSPSSAYIGSWRRRCTSAWISRRKA